MVELIRWVKQGDEDPNLTTVNARTLEKMARLPTDVPHRETMEIPDTGIKTYGDEFLRWCPTGECLMGCSHLWGYR